MNELIRVATIELARFLGAQLPKLSDDWWSKHVDERLSFQQQRLVAERRITTLQQLDLAALLRVLDQNWYELSQALRLPREGRAWVKELQTVRNKWAHLSGESLPPSENYRDVDTLHRVLAMLGAEPNALAIVEAARSAAVMAMMGGSAVVAPVTSGPAAAVPTPTPEPPPNPRAAPTLFKVGDVVVLRARPAESMPVMEVVVGGAECRYRVFHNGAKAVYYESQLQLLPDTDTESRATSITELHAQLTGRLLLAPSTANLFSLRSGRVQFVPYQYRPVLKLIRADRPRLLIADEVGVGKTIEAGLIIKELRARSEIDSILIICPKALVAERKWLNEMKRFDEEFETLDGSALRHCIDETDLDGEWPERSRKAIVPFSLFDSDLIFGRSVPGKRKVKGLLSLDPAPKFDLVIVDEAHHIRNADTFLHQAVRYFCDNAEAALFLTATPVQLGSHDLFTLLNVLRPDLVIDPASFEQMAAPNPSINSAVRLCRSGQLGWQHEARAQLDAVAQTEWGRMFVRESPGFQSVYDRLGSDGLEARNRVALTHEIEDLYTFSPMINRTRRRDIGEFTTRKPETVTVEFTPDQRRLHDGLLDVVERILAFCHGRQNVKFMMTTIRRQAASCLYGLTPLLQDMLDRKLDRLELMESSDTDEEVDLGFIDEVRGDIEGLLEQMRRLNPKDPKVEAFVQVLRDKGALANNKALVFSTFRHTLAYLARNAASTGLRIGLVHGDVPDEERASLRRRFALAKDQPEAIDVLLSSEVGCEGLDFQFCDLLVNYDLPWNPMRIEQRIGRLDRYGQKSETVAIVNLITPGTVDADIYERCLSRIGVFQHAVGGSEEILGEITAALHDIAESFALTAAERQERLRQLADNSIRQIREEQELESKQADLFGLNVPGQRWRDEIEAAESFWLSAKALQGSVRAYLASRLGSEGEHLLGEKPLKTLRLSQEARDALLDDYRQLPRSVEPTARQWEKWLKGGQPTLAVTFDQEAAAETPQAVHLSVLHPLLKQAARYLSVDEPVRVSLTVRAPELTAGVHPFALYRWSKVGVRADELLMPVSTDARVEAALLKLLESAADESDYDPSSFGDSHDALELRHHGHWTEARANHIAANRELVEHRSQSLTASHRARRAVIEEQLRSATNEKIRLMKESELARAEADFNRRMAEIQRSVDAADILATPVVFGTMAVLH
jgi:ERCC4-related helicase